MLAAALISEQGPRAPLRVGAGEVDVDAAELRASAACSGLDLVMLGPGELKIILRDAAACELVRLAWTDALELLGERPVLASRSSPLP